MPERTLEELAESFALFSDWEERYRYLIDLGARLPPMDDALKVEEHLVRGCTSKVWLVPSIQNGVFHFMADSDAQIVRGLVYLLMVAFQDKPVDYVRTYDIRGAFERLGLHQHLSPNRRNGFFAMVEKIRALAGAV
ncbi:MAG: SufE family protein [Micavibrio aeruginosavorus]|uniref:SufE family protein n=1 Tax=Micavibrio aeruginosavorus TaxID=349221 RepID=A0A7T5R192_9BACT|nr:MAG: SufE family protein [Micavibrio aeruginosavorus]